MTTIKEMLDKIKWDSKEKGEEYEIGYWDRIEKKEIRIKYEKIIDYDNLFMNLGESEIPLHRIKKVYKNGKLVWERK